MRYHCLILGTALMGAAICASQANAAPAACGDAQSFAEARALGCLPDEPPAEPQSRNFSRPPEPRQQAPYDAQARDAPYDPNDPYADGPLEPMPQICTRGNELIDCWSGQSYGAPYNRPDTRVYGTPYGPYGQPYGGQPPYPFRY